MTVLQLPTTIDYPVRKHISWFILLASWGALCSAPLQAAQASDSQPPAQKQEQTLVQKTIRFGAAVVIGVALGAVARETARYFMSQEQGKKKKEGAGITLSESPQNQEASPLHLQFKWRGKGQAQAYTSYHLLNAKDKKANKKASKQPSPALFPIDGSRSLSEEEEKKEPRLRKDLFSASSSDSSSEGGGYSDTGKLWFTESGMQKNLIGDDLEALVQGDVNTLMGGGGLNQQQNESSHPPLQRTDTSVNEQVLKYLVDKPNDEEEATQP